MSSCVVGGGGDSGGSNSLASCGVNRKQEHVKTVASSCEKDGALGYQRAHTELPVRRELIYCLGQRDLSPLQSQHLLQPQSVQYSPDNGHMPCTHGGTLAPWDKGQETWDVDLEASASFTTASCHDLSIRRIPHGVQINGTEKQPSGNL